ncbi:Hypothetical protein NGAL_HAMBI2427_03300 [Neorhizobium galegae bv. orientalis]|jgi:hypothetical protein|uniref:Uncharacterized protein n=2 Tax=Neorhizobium galegae TaxID=399 RepID=A0A068SYB2_NEOGA|nr:Hypothetical protein RG540_PA01450 [Neorhizobium galegae bv. orientalis str. HAMBI 540]CDZ43697.1 Hypothetical protein NGAL_HAMBI2427_03300 [Neorhizobium galegae bv. orientalis]
MGYLLRAAIAAAAPSPFPTMETRLSIKLFALSALALSTIAAPVLAQPIPSMVKKFDAWGLYSYKGDGGTTCYVLTTPTQMQPANVDHGDNFFLVAPKPSGSGFYPQAIMGYDLKGGSQMTVTVDGRTFALEPKGNSGWTKQESADAALVAAMKSGSSMTLEAVSQRGTQTSYTFSLSGVSAALTQAGRCG